MDTEVKIGNIVQLKSGGPWMTVVGEPDEKSLVKCRWFRKINGEWSESTNEYFHIGALRGKPENSLSKNE
jgi:uncharacterized protein YodC (DUF2158 family)